MNNRIKKLRTEQGLLLKDLSNMCSLSTSYLCHLEKGKRINPSYDSMKKISVALNKPLSEVFILEE